jgi:hypothetical protein
LSVFANTNTRTAVPITMWVLHTKIAQLFCAASGLARASRAL